MTINYSHIADATFPAASATAQTVLQNAVGIMLAYGATVPVDGTTGYTTGCIFSHQQGATDKKLYVNDGNEVSSNFNLMLTSDNLGQAGSASGTAAGRGPSPLIWDTCPVLDFILDPTQGWVFFDDFIAYGPVLAANQSATALGNWIGFTGATAGSTIAMATDAREGECIISADTANEDSNMSVLNGSHTSGHVTFEAGKKTWMECRVKVDDVTNAHLNAFIGFGEEGLNTSLAIISNTDAVTDKDLIGFVVLTGDGDAWQTQYNTDGGGGVTVLSATAAVITINTYSKLGIYCDGTTIFFYHNGVLLADSIALSAANIPDGEELAFYLSLQAIGADDVELSIDWIRIAQQF